MVLNGVGAHPWRMMSTGVTGILCLAIGCSSAAGPDPIFAIPQEPHNPSGLRDGGLPQSSPPPPGVVNPRDGSVVSNPASCKVDKHSEAFELPVCKLKAPPESFSPVLQWSVELGNGFGPPLVANLTDDNGDGEIDLCDIPDVVVMAGYEPPNIFEGRLLPEGANLYVLDGATGREHFKAETKVDYRIIPAIGDIDGDGLPDIVSTGGLLDQFLGG
jgi:hypothetical protein